ncbi:MAG: PD-(D/E)XK nuclease family protein, partial [Actinomycetota bacterium]|nr:PD-(D/E)XK nuclease family protein [Actinomycetota bacterium]
PDSDPDLADLDAEIDTLLTEAGRGRDDDTVVVDLPGALAATTALRLRADPEGLARDLARPMPRRPSPAGRLGTRFHAWVESHLGQQQLIGPDELPGRADSHIDDDADLRELTEAFRAGPYSDRTPYALEAPFQLVLAGQLVVGRIDAVYARPDGGFDVVDWKTNRREDADPNQLAIYRLAWAELHDLPVERVGAAFYYVRTGTVIHPPGLPGRADLATALLG